MTVYASEGATLDPTPAVVEPVDEPVIPEVVDAVVEPELAADEIHDAEVVTTLDTIDTPVDTNKWAHEPDWKYDELDYKGDRLAFRVPASTALTALYTASGTCSEEFVMKLTNQFVQNHLSQKSIERVLERMSDPDDTEFNDSRVWNDLLSKIAEIGGDRALKDAEELAAVTSGKGK